VVLDLLVVEVGEVEDELEVDLDERVRFSARSM